jgi:heat shock protein HspQ
MNKNPEHTVLAELDDLRALTYVKEQQLKAFKP